MSEIKYEISGFISDTHSDPVDTTTFDANPETQASYVPGSQTVTVHSGLGSIELPWDAHPMLKVGHPVTLTVTLDEGAG